MVNNGIRFEDYDKITDTILWFSSDVSLKFSVSLGTKRRDGTKYSFHQEYVYTSRYNDYASSRSIKRSIDAYLSIDVRNDFENSIMIKYQNMIMFKLKLNNVIQWFTKLFKFKDNKLRIIGKYENIIMMFDFGKCLEFEPIVIEYEDKTCKEGVRMYINSKNVYVDISIDKFMALYYIIDKFDIYQNAITLLNYLQRPEFGTNLYSVTDFNEPENIDFSKRTQDRGNGSNSFFNKI